MSKFREQYENICLATDVLAHPAILVNSYHHPGQLTGPNDTDTTQSTTVKDVAFEVVCKGCRLDLPSSKVLIEALSKSPGIRRLSLWNVETTGNALMELLLGVSKHDTIDDLCVDMTPAVSSVLSHTDESNLEFFSKLKVLSLRSNNLGDKEASSISKFISNNPTLTSLSLWNNNIGNEGAKRIGEALRANRTIRYLSLGKNQIGNAGAEYLSNSIGLFKLTPQQVFERKKNIVEMEKRKKEAINRKRRVIKSKSKKQGDEPASSSKLTVVQQQQKAPAQSATDDSLTMIDILIEELEVVDMDGVSYGKGNRSLVYFNMSNNQITAEVIVKMFEDANAANQTIQEINLNDNPIPDENRMPVVPPQIQSQPDQQQPAEINAEIASS